MSIDFVNIAPNPAEAARRAYEAGLVLGSTKGSERDRAIQAIVEAIGDRQDEILEANTLDLEVGREMDVPDLILDWLKLTPDRLNAAVQLLQRLGELSDPIRRVMSAEYQAEYSQTYCRWMPLGAIALIYEAFPELAVIAAGMCLKTGNSLVLQGSREAMHSNLILAEVLKDAVSRTSLPLGCIELLPSDDGDSLRELVTQDRYLSLVIPYGRPSLRRPVIQHATIPVLRSAMGNCYLYWSPSAGLDLVRWMILDSHQSQPDPVNAIEKVLVPSTQKPSSLKTLWNSLKEKGFQIRGDRTLVAEFPELQLVDSPEWNQAYLTRTVAFKVVENLTEAVSWINQYSSGHADSIATESYPESCQFILGVNSASTYVNTSPRFNRMPKRSNSILLGMSNQRGYHRGFIGLEALTRIKHIIQGQGET